MERIERVQRQKRNLSLTVPQITVGAALINRVTRVFTNKYPNARDFGINIIPNKFGLYFLDSD